MAEKQFVLYEHVFPNGKRYIGISSDVKNRWKHRYDTQQKMARAINKYGWDNIEHNILLDGLTKEQAERAEKLFIVIYDTINNGYNTAIGGEGIVVTYLNTNVLKMINESKKIDKKFGYKHGQKQEPDDIVSFCEAGITNHDRAILINDIDDEINREHSDYKNWYANQVYSGQLEMCEAYFYYMREILYKRLAGKPYSAEDIDRYETYINKWLFEGGVSDCQGQV